MFLLAVLLALLPPNLIASPGDPGCATQPIFATSGNGQVSLVNVNYAGFPTVALGKVTITTTVSCGPQNKWLVTAQQVMAAASGTVNEGSYGCIWIFSGTGITPVDFLTFAGPATICNSAPANAPAAAIQIAGGPIFGGTNPNNIVQGGSQVIQSHFFLPNSTSVTLQFAASANQAGGSILTGFSYLQADPI